MPNWNDVHWNHAAAAEAATALRRMATELERGVAERTRHSATALTDWRGPHRQRFEAELRADLEALLRLAAHCREDAGAVDRNDVRAREEQRNRERDREDWEREKRRRSNG